MNHLARLDESTEAIILATRILGSTSGSLVVTSYEDGAGKTTLCQLLATVASERMKRRVVYVDLNLRHPARKDLFAERSPDDRLECRQLGADYSDLPGWAKRERIASLLERPDDDALVIVDTSPLGIFNRNNVHPVHLAEWIREFVLVVAQDSSRHSQIRQAKSLLETHGISLVGAVLNQHGEADSPDAASITGWKSVYRALNRFARRWPVLRERFKGAFHAVRILWRLHRPGVRRAFEATMSSLPMRILVGGLRRVAPAMVSGARRALSILRSRIDRLLLKGDRRWTRN